MNLQVQRTLQLVIIAMYSALVFALKEAINLILLGGFNIEVTTFLISFAGIAFPFSMAFPIPIIFCFCEMFLRGFATWNILYLIVWPLVIIIIYSGKKMITKKIWIFIAINGFFGFTFGTIDALINLLLFSRTYFWAYWSQGWIFDIVHGFSNIVVVSILFPPLWNVWNKKLKYYLTNATYENQENQKTAKPSN